MTTRPDDDAHDDTRGGASVGARAIPRSARTPLGVLAIVTLWVAMAVLNPDVTYHLAPAVVAWSVPYLGGTKGTLGGIVTAAAGGLVAAVGTAAVLHSLGWLNGPVLFGGDAFGEAVWMAAAAAAVAIGVGLARRQRQAAPGTDAP